MKQYVDYSVIIEKQKRLGTNNFCYMAYVPALGIATEADTIKQARQEIESLVKFHLDCLAKEGEKIPIETVSPILTSLKTDLPESAQTISA